MERFILTVVAFLGHVIPQTLKANETVYNHTIRSSALVLSKEGLGTGVLIDVDLGLVLTNAHVVGEADKVGVAFPRFSLEREAVTDIAEY
jgi:S1-C subfamily serine protease